MSRGRMTQAQAVVAAQVLQEESVRRRHLVVHLSGAHAYGFPSPDSDLDLKSVHIEQTRRLVGLSTPRSTFDRQEVIAGVEVDYTSNELQQALGGVLKGDGNMLERLMSHDPVHADPCLAELQPLLSGALSRRFHRHYAGFARSQARQVLEAEAPSAKKVLYVLRTAVTGTHLLLERECQPDLTALAEPYGLPEVPELVAAKLEGEGAALGPEWAPRIEPLIDFAMQMLDEAGDRSPLPEEPPGVERLEAWLVDLRLSGR